MTPVLWHPDTKTVAKAKDVSGFILKFVDVNGILKRRTIVFSIAVLT
jgi:hypothetical protein